MALTFQIENVTYAYPPRPVFGGRLRSRFARLSRRSSNGQAPPGNMPPENTPPENTPPENTPPENAPAGMTPADEAAIRNSPSSNGTSPTPVLRNVSLEIEADAITAVVGPSGVGKSTLLYLMGLLWQGGLQDGDIVYHCADVSGAGQDAAAQGAATDPQSSEEAGDPAPADGPLRWVPRSYRDIVGSESECALLRREHFGFALQSSYLLPTLRGYENVAMPLALRGVAKGAREEEARRLLRKTRDENLCQRALDYPNALSGGQRQRLAVLRAVIHNPRVLFADEPVSNLDKTSAEKIYELLRDWREGNLSLGEPPPHRTLVLVTHDTERASAFADHMIVFHADGRIEQQSCR